MGWSANKEGNSFYVLFEQGGIKRRVRRSSPDWSRLGFDSCKDIEEARELCRILSESDRVDRKELKRQKILIKNEHLMKCPWLPPQKVERFESMLRTYKVEEKYWSAAKPIVAKMGVEPSKWKDYPFRFYDHCVEKSWSLDYSQTILRALNAWGEFYCTGGYTRIRPPTGSDRTRIMLAYERYRGPGRRRVAGRLSFKILEEHRDKFTEEEYRWLYISRAFGLRPEEVDKSLTDPTKHVVERTLGPKPRWQLKVYQWKLERSESNPKKRWKAIDIVTQQQEVALKMLDKSFRQPTEFYGILGVDGIKVTAYGGRKDFYTAMVRKYGRAVVMDWMGHKSLDTGKIHYDDPSDKAPGYDEDEEAA